MSTLSLATIEELLARDGGSEHLRRRMETIRGYASSLGILDHEIGIEVDERTATRSRRLSAGFHPDDPVLTCELELAERRQREEAIRQFVLHRIVEGIEHRSRQ